MIRIYKWNDDIPSWIAEVKGYLIPSIKFNGLVIVWRFKGEIIIKPIFGKSVIKIEDGVNCRVEFKSVIMKSKSSPLNIFRRIRYILSN